MNPVPYGQLSVSDLLALCVWRESSDQYPLARAGVCWTIRNRVEHPTWWGHSYQTVILKPFQFSSFNASDINNTRWPKDDDESWPQVLETCAGVMSGAIPDPTQGATLYFSPPLTQPPHAWGQVDILVKLDELTFCKPKVVALGVKT